MKVEKVEAKESESEKSESESDQTESESEESEEENETTEIGFFLTKDKKPVQLKSNKKKVVKKVARNNRDGQWERKRHAKSVYGKHASGI